MAILRCATILDHRDHHHKNCNPQRAVNIKVKAQDEEGRPLTLTLNDFVARIFQHEYDHLQGTLYHDRMSPAVLDEVREQLVAMEDAYLQVHPGAAVQRVG